MKHVLLIVMFLSSFYSYACDACATSFGNIGDQTFQLDKNFVGINWTYFSQDVRITSFNKLVESNIQTQQITLLGAYNFQKKYHISISMPLFVTNYNSETSFSVGDAVLNFRYRLYQSSIKKIIQANHNVFVTSGIKFPIGALINNHTSEVNNITFSTKTIDLLFGASYNYEKNKRGINVSLNSKINFKNEHQLQKGHNFILKSFLYAKTSFKKTYWTPFVGLSAEYTTKDLSNGYSRPFSGGIALYFSPGFSLKIKNTLSIIINPEIPLLQQYNIQNGEMYSNIKININTKILF